MRILLTNTGPWGTGSGMVAEAILAELRQKGHQAILFFPDSQLQTPDKDDYYSRPELFRIWRFPIERENNRLATFPLMIPDPNPRSLGAPVTFRDLSEELLHFYFHEARRELSHLIDSFRPDIVESQHIWALGYVLKELGVPYVLTAHHSDQMGYRYDQRMQPYANQAAVDAQRIFTISSFVQHEVCELYPDIQPERVVLLENGYNHCVFYPKAISRVELLNMLRIEEPAGLPIISFSGKISRTKGVDVLLRANRLVQRERKTLLIIAGTGKLEEEFTRDERAAFHLENVYFVGHHPQPVLAELHNLAVCSVMPSRTEGFGIAALEAMGCGTPVVATRSGGPETFVIGATVPVENVEELASALLNMLTLNQESEKELRRAALEKARQYTWEHIVTRRVGYYCQALGLDEPP